MVYDITDENSFKQINEWRSKFMQQANIDNPRKYPFLLLGNKTDLEEKRKVSFNQGDNYAKDNGMEFAETSAFRGTNIEKAFENIAEYAAESDTVPFFTEDLVERIQMEDGGGGGGGGRGGDRGGYQQQPQGGCACQLL